MKTLTTTTSMHAPTSAPAGINITQSFEGQLLLQLKLHQDDLLQTRLEGIEARRERDSFKLEANDLRKALQSKNAELAEANELLSHARETNRKLINRFETEEKTWKSKMEDVLLRAAVDLNRQYRQDRCRSGAKKQRRSSTTTSHDVTGTPLSKPSSFINRVDSSSPDVTLLLPIASRCSPSRQISANDRSTSRQIQIGKGLPATPSINPDVSRALGTSTPDIIAESCDASSTQQDPGTIHSGETNIPLEMCTPPAVVNCFTIGSDWHVENASG